VASVQHVAWVIVVAQVKLQQTDALVEELEAVRRDNAQLRSLEALRPQLTSAENENRALLRKLDEAVTDLRLSRAQASEWKQQVEALQSQSPSRGADTPTPTIMI